MGSRGAVWFLGCTTFYKPVWRGECHAPPKSLRCSKMDIDANPSASAAFARTIPVAPVSAKKDWFIPAPIMAMVLMGSLNWYFSVSLCMS